MNNPDKSPPSFHLHHDIPKMRAELEEVIALTEKATLDIIKVLESKNQAFPEEVSQILHSLTFQDITGQRITKVLKFLKELEKSLEEVEKAGAISFGAPKTSQASVSDKESLLNGPQLPGEGVSQKDIDKYLK